MTYEKERSAFFKAYYKINRIGRLMTRIGARSLQGTEQNIHYASYVFPKENM